MRTAWSDAHGAHSVIAPVSLVVSAFAPVADARRTLTAAARSVAALAPAADRSGRRQESLGRIVLGAGVRASAAASRRISTIRGCCASFFAAVRELKDQGLLLAYHDRSDGGLLVTLLEMAFAGHCGLDIDSARPPADAIAACFAEELGAVVQVPAARVAEARAHSRAPRARRALQRYRRARGRQPRCSVRIDGRTAVCGFARRSAPPLERGVVSHAGAARQSGMRSRGVFPAPRCARPGLARGA